MQLTIISLIYFIAFIFFSLSFFKRHKLFEKIGVFSLILAILWHITILSSQFIGSEVSLRYFMVSLSVISGFTTILLLSKSYVLSYSHIFFGLPFFLLVFDLKAINQGVQIKLLFSIHLFHLTSSILALTFLTISFVAAILFLVQHDQLKRKSIGYLTRRIPALNSLDALSFVTIILGFFCLTIAIVSGGMREYAGNLAFFSMGGREWLIFLAWIIYAIYFRTRYAIGYLGPRLAIAAIFSYIVQIVAIFLMMGIHRTF